MRTWKSLHCYVWNRSWENSAATLQKCVPLQICGLLVAIGWSSPTPYRCLRLHMDRCAHHRWWLLVQAGSLVRILLCNVWWLPRPLLQDRCFSSSQICWKISAARAWINNNSTTAPYYTSRGLSFDALLKNTDVQLKLLSYIDMHLFIDKCWNGNTC